MVPGWRRRTRIKRGGRSLRCSEATNSGVSLTPDRTHAAKTRRTRLATSGTRHPQATKSSLLSPVVRPARTSVANAWASGEAIATEEPARPRRSVGACSRARIWAPLISPPGGDPLDEPEDDEDDRSRDADRRVARQQADERGCQPHDPQGGDQDATATAPVPDRGEDDAADGPGREGDPVGGERRDERCRTLQLAEEDGREDRGRQQPEDREVEVLERGATGCREGGAALHAPGLLRHGRGRVDGHG